MVQCQSHSAVEQTDRLLLSFGRLYVLSRGGFGLCKRIQFSIIEEMAGVKILKARNMPGGCCTYI